MGEPLRDLIGYKDDCNKPRTDLLPASALLEVSRVLAFGAKKYGAWNWQSVPDGRHRYCAAALRHIFASMDGERMDNESGLPHLAHAACCLLFLLWIDMEDGRNERTHQAIRP